MGTRGLLGFVIGAKRHAAYNPYDSYPDGLGKNIVQFILGLKPQQYELMARRVSDITWVDQSSTPCKDLQERYQKAGFCDPNASETGPSRWHCLLHNTQGAAALPLIKSKKLLHMVENIGYLNQGCEWAYFLDFQNKELETWSSGTLQHVIAFERLRKQGKGYMDRFHDGFGDKTGTLKEIDM